MPGQCRLVRAFPIALYRGGTLLRLYPSPGATVYTGGEDITEISCHEVRVAPPTHALQFSYSLSIVQFTKVSTAFLRQQRVRYK
eukprot:COSAG02_NODE_1154_length_14189_cov_10.515614_3_plen_84_part_00